MRIQVSNVNTDHKQIIFAFNMSLPKISETSPINFLVHGVNKRIQRIMIF